MLESPLLFCRINYTQIIYTGVSSTCLACCDKIHNSNRQNN
jgi:hypothetical protein